MSELILWMDKEMNKMKRDMDRLFRESRPEIGVGLFQEKVSQHMPVETFMTKEAFIIRAVIPGVDPENLDISVKDYQLTIKGRKKEETVESGTVIAGKWSASSGLFNEPSHSPSRLFRNGSKRP